MNTTKELTQLIDNLLVALHDAINSPKGVVPDSAWDFYCPRWYDNKEKVDG